VALTHDTRQLNWFLAWAVVFCDIGTVTAIGMITAIGVRRSWFVDLVVRVPFIQRLQAQAYRASEDLVEDELKGLGDSRRGGGSKTALFIVHVLGHTRRIAAADSGRPDARQRTRRIGDVLYLCRRMARLIRWRESPRSKRGKDSNAPRGASGRTAKNIEVIPIWAVSHNAAPSDSQMLRKRSTAI
jgi:hypothetical protein